jgi:hypothetical protein
VVAVSLVAQATNMSKVFEEPKICVPSLQR